MSRFLVSRRRFLTLPLLALMGSALRPWAPPRLWAEPQSRRQGRYDVDVGILYGALSLTLDGTVEETHDPVANRYRVRAVGQGRHMSNRLESEGALRGGRWAPLQSEVWVEVAGRTARTAVEYDYDRARLHYVYRAETFFLRRVRQADDVLEIPEGLHLDDALTATLNYAEARWLPEPDGVYRTHVVRRRRPEDEGPDDVQQAYRAEIVPVALQVQADPETGRPTALLDLTPFSSWARRGRPARVVFGPGRRPERIHAWLMLGTTVRVRIGPV
jgi:hypothetical protein